MKESITKFDLEAAFRALDAIDVPKTAKGLKANRVVLTEKISSLPKTEALMEEYYDIGNTSELENAKEDREAEVAKAKLARIEKIVDLDADSADELLASYVGKYIVQCPQCMTLFYKNKEDVIESEDDETVVNVNEVCQHCGNESGYTLIGKVGAAEEEIPADEATGDLDLPASEDTGVEGAEGDIDLDAELSGLDFNFDDAEGEGEGTEEATGDAAVDDELAELDFEIEDDEEDKKESLNVSYLNTPLTEDMDVSASEFKSLISSPEFKKPISSSEVHSMLRDLGESTETPEAADAQQDEEVLEEGVKDVLKNAVNKVVMALKSRESKADWVLNNALEDNGTVQIDNTGKLLPDKDDKRFSVFVIIGYQEKYTNGKRITQPPTWDNKDLIVGKNGVKTFNNYKAADSFAKGWSQRQGNGPAFIYLAKDEDDENAIFLCEYFDGNLVKEKDQLNKYFELVKKDVEGAKLMKQHGAGDETTSDDENSKGINKGTEETQETPETTTEAFNQLMNDLEDLHESSLSKFITESLLTSYANVAGFKVTNCELINESLNVDGTIVFTSGKSRNVTYRFNEAFTNDQTNTVVLKGLNEKLGSEKAFLLTAKKDTENKTLITESFKVN